MAVDSRVPGTVGMRTVGTSHVAEEVATNNNAVITAHLTRDGMSEAEALRGSLEDKEDKEEEGISTAVIATRTTTGVNQEGDKAYASLVR